MLLPRKRGFHQPQASPSSELQLANPEPLPSTYDSSITARRSFDSRLAVNPYRAREEDEPKTHSQPQASSSTSTSLQPSHLVPLPSTYIGSASARASSGSHRATTALPVSHSVLREYREELIGGRLEIVAHYHNPPAGWNAQHGRSLGISGVNGSGDGNENVVIEIELSYWFRFGTGRVSDTRCFREFRMALDSQIWHFKNIRDEKANANVFVVVGWLA
ncbi:uncharacterized protein L3040_003795 [Drepanopeziza brunnea f. sp. 'multigermtubi']|uniref:uncharacterized protein n=1 Tax=Drepanopeziza brunnea f. sp. 'multigermtubi' TaxID=698441 RepID=UPI00238E7760|nr:hypothetical protein L3040_003795 [Drepanopeziza brunnea f. sp. 'multigermtubi']